MTAVCLFPVFILKCFFIPAFYLCQFEVCNFTYPQPTGCRVKASSSTYLEEEFNIPLLSRIYLICLSCTSPRGIFHIAISELVERMNWWNTCDIAVDVNNHYFHLSWTFFASFLRDIISLPSREIDMKVTWLQCNYAMVPVLNFWLLHTYAFRGF